MVSTETAFRLYALSGAESKQIRDIKAQGIPRDVNQPISRGHATFFVVAIVRDV
jgi:hypothetical protein